jgi:hypothetical protein
MALAADCMDYGSEWWFETPRRVLAVCEPDLRQRSHRALVLCEREGWPPRVLEAEARDKRGPCQYRWAAMHPDMDRVVGMAGGLHCRRVWIGDGEVVFNEWHMRIKLEEL